MKKCYVIMAVFLVALSLVSAPAIAAKQHEGKGVPSPTTLDACGYFKGTQTPSTIKESTVDGVTYKTERGTWEGIINVGDGSQVGSLGAVKGSYHLETITYADGSISGTESFNSDAGKIDQVFAIGPGFSSFDVSVVATRDLAFLTSGTDGECYAGPVPRP